MNYVAKDLPKISHASFRELDKISTVRSTTMDADIMKTISLDAT